MTPSVEWWVSLIEAVIVINLVMATFAYLTLAERKIMGRMQLRYGPNRAGFRGMLQPIADLLKLLNKESFQPTEAISWAFVLGPFLADFLRGGGEIGSETLARFYSMHMLLIPGLIFALIGLHLYLVIRLGVSSPPWSREAAGSDYDADQPATNGRSGLTQPAARSGWRRNGGDDV